MAVTEKTGSLVAIKNVDDTNDLMIINQSGITLRLPVSGIRVMGRATQGVKLIDLNKRGDHIASVCKVDSDPEETVDDEVLQDLDAQQRLASDKAEAISETETEAADIAASETPGNSENTEEKNLSDN